MKVNLPGPPHIESQDCTDMLLPLDTSDTTGETQDVYCASSVNRFSTIRWRIHRLEEDLLTNYVFNPMQCKFEQQDIAIEEVMVGLRELPNGSAKNKLLENLRCSLLNANIKACIQYVTQKKSSLLALQVNLNSYKQTADADFKATQQFSYFNPRYEITILEKMRFFVLSNSRALEGSCATKTAFLKKLEETLCLITQVGSQFTLVDRFCKSQQVYNTVVHLCEISSLFVSKCDVDDCLKFILPDNTIDIHKLKELLSPFDEEIQKTRELAMQPQDIARFKQAEEAWLSCKSQLLINISFAQIFLRGPTQTHRIHELVTAMREVNINLEITQHVILSKLHHLRISLKNALLQEWNYERQIKPLSFELERYMLWIKHVMAEYPALVNSAIEEIFTGCEGVIRASKNPQQLPKDFDF